MRRIWKKAGVVLVSGGVTAVALAGLWLLLSSPAQAASPAPAPAEPAHTQGITTTTFLPLVIAPPESGDCYYVEVDDAVVIEMESVPAVEEWQLETGYFGYTGSGYYVWRGPDYLGTPGVGILSYPLSITKDATYQLNIRNTHLGPATEQNDIWVRLDGGPWTKAFSHITEWNYFLQFDFQNGQPHDWVYFHNLEAGLHTLDIAARSAGFHLDRLVFSSNGMGQLDTWPESPCVVP